MVDRDPLGPSRGIARALLIGLGIWIVTALIILGWWL